MRIRAFLVFAIALVLVAVALPAGAAKKTIEQYQANALVTGYPGQGASSTLTINIYRWSSDEEREEILDGIRKASGDKYAYRATPQALRQQKKAGYMFLAGKQGYPLRYARQFESGGQRQIVLATDRPVTFAEVYRGEPAREFDVTLIVLKLDDQGQGEGIASVGTEMVWNEKEGKLQVTNFSSQPVSLQNVRKTQ